MNRRIKKKIQKRDGFKNWNNFYLHCVDRVIRRVTRDSITGGNDMIYTVVSRKVRKRKILRLCVLKNCYPISCSSNIPGDKDIEFTATQYCRDNLHSWLVDDHNKRIREMMSEEGRWGHSDGSLYTRFLTSLIEGQTIKHPPLSENEEKCEQTLADYLLTPAKPNAQLERHANITLPNFPGPYEAHIL